MNGFAPQHSRLFKEASSKSFEGWFRLMATNDYRGEANKTFHLYGKEHSTV